MSQRAVALLSVLFLLAAGCSSKFMRNFSSNLEGDPYGNWEMRAARVPTSSEACVSSCKQHDEACFRHLQDPGMNGNAQEMEQCYEAMYQCYLGCPDSNEKVAQYKDLKQSEAMRAACKEELTEGDYYCMTRNGIVGAAIDP